MTPRVVLLMKMGATAMLVAIGVGCSQSTADVGESQPQIVNPTPSRDVDDGGSAPDAPQRPARLMVGSPLCNASLSGCHPDDSSPANAAECGLSSSNGPSDASGAFDNVQLACRVQAASRDAGAQPVCSPSGTATDGMSCYGASDCAPGYECTGYGTCRHYCCAGECTNQNEFCDLQPMVDSAAKVPVCMPIHSCGLLDQSSATGPCPRSQTCAVVRDNGATSCVGVGPRQAGDECDTDHCERGSVCLGTSGDRRCYTLCHTTQANNECTSTPKEMCKGGLPLFPLPGIGICQ
jgi:hypothetical protein